MRKMLHIARMDMTGTLNQFQEGTTHTVVVTYAVVLLRTKIWRPFSS